ncbi:hypothetical protein ABZ543_12660 [Streptomyces roseifaciens]
MITPRVPAVASARADFDELEVIATDNDMHWAEGTHVLLRVWRSPDGQMVQWINMEGHTATVEDAAWMAERLHLTPGAHFFVYASTYAEDFEQTLDKALGGDVRITLLEREPMHPEVAAVPMPDPAPAVTVSLTISEQDFDLLTHDTFHFDDERFVEMLESCAPGKTPVDDVVDSHWKMVYTIGREAGSYADVMLATAFLRAQGYTYELATDHDGDWWILTDFKTAMWRRHDGQKQAEARLLREKAEASGDELAKLYLADSAKKPGEERNG